MSLLVRFAHNAAAVIALIAASSAMAANCPLISGTFTTTMGTNLYTPSPQQTFQADGNGTALVRISGAGTFNSGIIGYPADCVRLYFSPSYTVYIDGSPSIVSGADINWQFDNTFRLAPGTHQIFLEGKYVVPASNSPQYRRSSVVSITVTAPQQPQPQPPGEITGWIDGVYKDASGIPTVYGWACQQRVARSIDVHVYLGGAWPTGTIVTGGPASVPAESAVSAACGTSNVPHRFSFPIYNWRSYPGMGIYVHGISTTGGNNSLLGHSGTYTIPAN
ncbi:hypothetical protein [Chitiniphilus eburneus]|uniref:Uncharacterized protein n=1 Tax=Chitiniphilus eburneus TaxID=2571148 RepID=A0A4U0QE38_9NEIS|nr:hypothetical protein [Chitiniphilus eburneus]TJZ78892.1 hypothetical protein FAZ21_00990 [Chitiniphilus eburneus]